MDTKQPIRQTLKAMEVGQEVTFAFERYESVVAAASRLNVTIPGKRWTSAIIRDNPDDNNPIAVRVTRIE